MGPTVNPHLEVKSGKVVNKWFKTRIAESFISITGKRSIFKNKLCALSNKLIMSEEHPKKSKKNYVGDLFAKVTESLKSIPVSPIRLSVPYRFKLYSSTSNNDDLPSEIGISSNEAELLKTHLTNGTAFPFLGENVSMQEISYVNAVESNVFLLPDGIARSRSLEGFSMSFSKTPCMIRMPPTKSHMELGDEFKNIPLYSWFLPYIISCAPPQFLHALSKLPPLFQNITSASSLLPSSAASPDPLEHKEHFHLLSSGGGRARAYSGEVEWPHRIPRTSSFGDDIYSATPQPQQPPNPNNAWRSLGVVYLSKDPVCRVWEQKLVYLLDNFLLELTVDGLNVIGFAALCGCSVSRQSYATVNHRRDKSWRHLSSSNTESGNGYTSESSNNISFAADTVSSALVVTCYTSSQISICATATFCLTVRHSDAAEEQLGLLEQAILAASSLGVGDIYNLGGQQTSGSGSSGAAEEEDTGTPATPDTEKSLLGRGRYSEVHLSSRVLSRDIFAKSVHSADHLHSTANPSTGMQSPGNNNDSIFPDTRDRSGSLRSIPETCAVYEYSSTSFGSFGYGSSGGSFMLGNSSGAMSSEQSPSYDPVIHSISTRFRLEEEAIAESEKEDQPDSIATLPPAHTSTASGSSTGQSSGDDELDCKVHGAALTLTQPAVAYELRCGLSSGYSSDESSGPDSDGEEGPDELDICLHNGHPTCSSTAEVTAVSQLTVLTDKCQPTAHQETTTNEVEPDLEASLEAQACAVKLVSKEVFWQRICKGQERTDSLVREVLSQALVSGFYEQHQAQSGSPTLSGLPVHGLSVVKLSHVLETIDGFVVEMEVRSRHDLFDLLARDGPMSELSVAYIAMQLVEAIAVCNHLGIAHRDVKLSNITLPPSLDNIEGSSGLGWDVLLDIKLADFGMAGFTDCNHRLKGRCGTPGYVAPDILNAAKNDSYPINVDMFSIGVAVYTLLCGYEPFYGENDQELLASNKAVKFAFHPGDWRGISPECKDFISQCLRPDAQERLLPTRAAEHPWMAKHIASIQARQQEQLQRKEGELESAAGGETTAGGKESCIIS